MPDQRILCLRRTALEERIGAVPLGFTTDVRVVDGLRATARATGEFRPRPALEEDPTFLQVIVQGLVANGREVLALFRASREQTAGRFVETRHNDKVALSAGGHVERAEVGEDDPLTAALLRELAEELVFAEPPAPADLRPVGVLCRASPDAEMFQRVHIGLVFHVPTTGAVSLPPGSDEFTGVEFAGSGRLRELYPRMEGWGQLLADALLTERLRVVG